MEEDKCQESIDGGTEDGKIDMEPIGKKNISQHIENYKRDPIFSKEFKQILIRLRYLILAL